MEDQQSGRKRQIITTLAVLIVVAVIVAAAAVANKKDDSQEASTVTPDTSSQTDASTTTSNPDAAVSNANSSSSYKDGTYEATGSYNTPGGTESIAVSVTLKDGVVTGSSVTSKAEDAESKEYQGKFIGGYKQYVTGKKIEDISLSRVAGSSLTPQGFNDAIDTIQQQAQA